MYNISYCISTFGTICLLSEANPLQNNRKKYIENNTSRQRSLFQTASVGATTLFSGQEHVKKNFLCSCPLNKVAAATETVSNNLRRLLVWFLCFVDSPVSVNLLL